MSGGVAVSSPTSASSIVSVLFFHLTDVDSCPCQPLLQVGGDDAVCFSARVPNRTKSYEWIFKKFRQMTLCRWCS